MSVVYHRIILLFFQETKFISSYSCAFSKISSVELQRNGLENNKEYACFWNIQVKILKNIMYGFDSVIKSQTIFVVFKIHSAKRFNEVNCVIIRSWYDSSRDFKYGNSWTLSTEFQRYFQYLTVIKIISFEVILNFGIDE